MKNGKFKIETGIPIPERLYRGRAGVISTLMRGMKNGDSILLHSARGTANAQASEYIGKGKYTIRPDGKGFRVWKIA